MEYGNYGLGQATYAILRARSTFQTLTRSAKSARSESLLLDHQVGDSLEDSNFLFAYVDLHIVSVCQKFSHSGHSRLFLNDHRALCLRCIVCYFI